MELFGLANGGGGVYLSHVSFVLHIFCNSKKINGKINCVPQSLAHIYLMSCTDFIKNKIDFIFFISVRKSTKCTGNYHSLNKFK